MDMTRNEELNEQFRAKAKELVAQMTLDEKVSQTTNWAKAVDRLGIKAYNWWNEALHGVARAGVATVFPQAITTAGSFDEDLVEKIADIISTEGRAKYNEQQKYNDTDIYKGLTFWSPNINIFRDPRWGRGHETYGEDPYLTSRLGARFVEGIQGHDEKYMKAAACAKHFAVHSGPEDIRHSFNAEVSDEDLWETYLPAFKVLVEDAKVEAVMGAYNRTNGEACCASKTLLLDILRDMWNFKGHVTSDCWALKDMNEGHGLTKNLEDSAALAANNGCDVNCGNCFELLNLAIKDGKVSEERLDEMVVNLFTTRMKLGLLGEVNDNPYDKINYLSVDTDESRKFNLEVALQSMTLLENRENALPLDITKIKTLGVIGPNANSRRALVGNYEGTSSEYITVLEGIRRYIDKYAAHNKTEKPRVLYSEGCHLYKDRVENLGVANDRMSEVKTICNYSDAVIVVVGLDATLEGEEGDTGNQYGSGDKRDLKLPGNQQLILDTAIASGKPVIAVLMAGSAMQLQGAEEKVAAYLYAGYPGAQGGLAVAKILFGEKSPEGKLPITFYHEVDELPDFTDYAMKGRTYRYMEKDALYPFGYGLSYSPVEMTNARVTPDESKGCRSLKVAADLTNLGKYETAETLQVYVSVHRDGAPKWQLKGLKKIRLLPGELKHVETELPWEALGLHLGKNEVTVEGEVTVYVGTHQPDSRSAALTGTEPEKFEITVNDGKMTLMI